MTGRIQQTSFEGSAGDRLDARLDLPHDDPVAFALFAHCFTCSKESRAATYITRGLVERGIGVLRFDFTGLGLSDGEFANTNFSSNVEDLVRAAGMLRERSAAPRLLVGHSLGGAAVLAAASAIPEAVAVATIAAPFEPAELAHLLPADAVAELDRSGEVIVDLGGRSFPIRRQLLDDVNAQNLTEAIRGLGRALLVLHAPHDELVDVDNARRIFEVARHPKSFVSLDHADHLLTRRVDATYVADVLGAWASRYLGGLTASDHAPLPAGTVVVGDAPAGRLAQRIRAGRHSLIADEPTDIGDDRGPTPYDLLLASLGACTAMTLRMYADRKGWPLDEVSVRLTHDRVHADDALNCAAGHCMIDRMELVLDLDGPLTDDQRQRLLEIAERCPVHRTLVGEKQIVTRLAVPLASHATQESTEPATERERTSIGSPR